MRKVQLDDVDACGTEARSAAASTSARAGGVEERTSLVGPARGADPGLLELLNLVERHRLGNCVALREGDF